jgi:cell division protein FtsW
MLALFGLLIWRGAVIAMRSSDMFGYLLAAGISCWLALEVVINVTVMVGLIPVAGNALPFISYGGSSLVVVMAAVGILLNISRSNISERPERNVYSPTDLRRGNRRSRLSGAGSSS